MKHRSVRHIYVRTSGSPHMFRGMSLCLFQIQQSKFIYDVTLFILYFLQLMCIWYFYSSYEIIYCIRIVVVVVVVVVVLFFLFRDWSVATGISRYPNLIEMSDNDRLARSRMTSSPPTPTSIQIYRYFYHQCASMELRVWIRTGIRCYFT